MLYQSVHYNRVCLLLVFDEYTFYHRVASTTTASVYICGETNLTLLQMFKSENI